jgi:hypothetical protein
MENVFLTVDRANVRRTDLAYLNEPGRNDGAARCAARGTLRRHPNRRDRWAARELCERGTLANSEPSTMPSRPGEFHPEPLTDPDMNLSIHPARVQGSPGLGVGVSPTQKEAPTELVPRCMPITP